VQVRRFLLIGRLDEAERMLAELDPAPFPPALRTAHELVVAGIAMRRLRTKTARVALTRAEYAARHANIPALTAEVESTASLLKPPPPLIVSGRSAPPARGSRSVARIESARGGRVPTLVRDAGLVATLARRPVLFALARALGEAWPGDVPRDLLVARHLEQGYR